MCAQCKTSPEISSTLFPQQANGKTFVAMCLKTFRINWPIVACREMAGVHWEGFSESKQQKILAVTCTEVHGC